MAVVAFDVFEFREQYPLYRKVKDEQLKMLFDFAQALFDNANFSLEQAIPKRKSLLYLLTAHLCDITFGDDNGNGSGVSGMIGRVANAAEGSVSVSLDVGQGLPYSQAWYFQSKWGQLFWQLTKPYRMFAYFPGIEVGCS
ncbi:DUF4054 domain-containing protein [Candidatus Arsenophonus triatominarum]|uniref:DUF4054 domain-containing protein n=1 Tax=Candidatus Arsenophonus triatominarum TaxID=57911 RepID=UPI0007C5435A|nr:DUF4054 domain-containing protein [Candidatus Arsenophonus triatominarum]